MQDSFGKLLSLVGGVALVAVFGTLGVEAWRDYRTFGDSPTRETLGGAVAASAGGRRWVSIEGASWRCADLVRNLPGGAAFLPASGADGATVVARFDGEIDCAAVSARPLRGIIEPMEAQRAADLRGGGLTLAAEAPLRTLDVCTSCGKANARLGVVMCTLFVLLGLALYPLRRAYRSLRGRADGALREAIHAPPARAEEADRTVRTWGGAALLAGVAAIAVGEGWVAYGVVPVRGIGVVALALGGWMVLSPAGYRRFSARAGKR